MSCLIFILDLNDWKRQSKAGVEWEAKSCWARDGTAQRSKKGEFESEMFN